MAERNVVTNVLPTWLGKRTPSPNVATTTANRWIDGTAGGSATNNQFGFYAITGVGPMSYQIIDGAVTLSATTSSSRGRVMTAPFETTTTQQNVNQYCFRLRPSTSYTFTCKGKGTDIFNSTTIRAQILCFNSGGATTTVGSTDYLPAGTSDYTTYSVTFTTSTTACFGIIYLPISTAGAVMSASFKDFQLDTTVPSTRTSARYMGGSTQFNGSTSNITTPLSLVYSGGFSVSFWYFQHGPLVNGARVIDNQDSGPVNGFRFQQDTTTGLNFVAGTGGGAFIPTPGKWVHVTGTNSATNGCKLYVNGVLVSSSGSSTPTTSAATLTFGKRATGASNFFNGKLAEVKFFNSELTASQVALLSQTGNNPVTPVASYTLSEPPSTYADTFGGATGTGTDTTLSPDTPVKQRVSARYMGTALDTFASSGYVSIGTAVNASINSTNAYTFAQWVKRGPVQGTLQSFMGAPAGDKAWFNFLADNSVRLYNQDLTPPAVNTLAAQRTITDQNWHLLVGTFDGTTRKIYIDGLPQTTSTATSTGTLSLNATFYVTAWPTGNNFRGKSDEPRIWNRALTAAEVANLYYNNVVPRTGLLQELLLDEGSGTTAIDTSGNGNNGTITNATYTTDTPVQQRVAVRDMGTALRFDGSSDFVTMTTALMPTTISFWATVNNSDTSYFFNAVPDNDIGVSTTGFWKLFDGSNRTSTIRATRAPQFMTFVFTGTGYQIYVNGVYREFVTSTQVTINTIGRSVKTPNGVIDEPRFYNRALTATEIANMYFNNIVPRNGLVAEYLFNEASGTTALDTSGNGNDGTITGATYTLDVPLKLRIEA